MDIAKELRSIAMIASCAPNDDEHAASREFTRIMEKARRLADEIERTPKPAVDHKRVLDTIHAELDGTEWDSGTMSVVASHLIGAGYKIREPS